MSPLVQRHKQIITIAIAVCLVTALSATAQAQWPQGNSSWPNTTGLDPGSMTLEIGGKAMNRRGDSNDLPLLRNSLTNQILFGSADATDLDTGPGAEVRIGFKGPVYNSKWEVRSFISNWDNNFQFDEPNLITTFNQGLEPETIGLGYESKVYSFELNYKRNTQPGLTWIAGPRVISVVEDYEIEFTDTIVGAGGVADFRQLNTQEARNTLYGFQLGFETNTPLTQKIHINTFARAGGYMNPTRARDSFTQFITIGGIENAGATGSSSRSKTTGAASLDAGVRIYSEVLPNSCYCYVGYEVFGLDGIATAPAQLLTVNMPDVEVNSSLWAESATFGLMFNY